MLGDRTGTLGSAGRKAACSTIDQHAQSPVLGFMCGLIVGARPEQALKKRTKNKERK